MNIKEYEKQIMDIAIEISRYLCSRGATPEDTQDCVQDTLVKILELDIFIKPSKLRAWMYRVSIRDYINKYHRAKKYQIIIEEIGRDLQAFETIQNETLDLLTLMKKLNPDEERILHAYYFDHLSTKEIAETFKISISKTKIGLYRSRKKLKKLIEKEELKLWH